MPTQTRNTRENIENRPEIRYQRPIGITPWSKGAGEKSSTGTVWISMKPKKIVDQFSKGAGTIGIVELNTEFLFLAPLNLNENIVHHWEAYESVASRLAQKARSAVKLGSEGTALFNAATNAISDSKSRRIFERSGLKEGAAIEDVATKAYNIVPSSRIPNIKVDTPLYYTNSDRRQIVFEFQLFNENIPGVNPMDILIKPIQELMKFSSPDLKSNIQIEFPFMWEIKTRPIEFIKYTTCALIGVQPTWNSPYINHIPSSVNLQLTFQDLSPLYAGTIESGTVIRVIEGGASRTVQEENTKIIATQKTANARSQTRQSIDGGTPQ